MWLDDLNELVGRLKERISQHKDVLSKSETATRYGLIDPLLTALGWDLQDPGQVQTEYKPDGGPKRSDYAMFTGEDEKKPRFVIEAKHLGKQINDDVIDQALSYCNKVGIPHFVVTNGSHWEMYKTSGDVHIKERRIVDFKLEDPTQTTVMKMLTLWRGNFESGSPIGSVAPDRLASQRTAAPVPQPESAGQPPSKQRPARGIPFDKFNPPKPIKGKRPPAPAALLFPYGPEKEKKIDNWFEIQTSVVEWLVEIGRLTEADCPVEGPGGRRLVHTSPEKKNGTKFQTFKQIRYLFVDIHVHSSLHVDIAKKILKARGVDPSDVRVVMKT